MHANILTISLPIYQSDPWLAGPLYVDTEIDVIANSQAEKQNVSVISY